MNMKIADFLVMLMSINISIAITTTIIYFLYRYVKNASAKLCFFITKIACSFLFLPILFFVLPPIQKWSYVKKIELPDAPDFKYGYIVRISYNKFINSSFYTFLCYLTFFFICIGFILIILYIVRFYRLSKQLKSNSTFNQKLTNLVNSSNFKLSKKISVYTNTNLPTSLTVGLFNPIIILHKTFDDKSQNLMILVHEMTHIKRKDCIINFLLNVFGYFYWYNPFIYLLKKLLNAYCEISCDEYVLNTFKTDEKKSYYRLLINNLQDFKAIHQKELNSYNLSFTTSNYDIIQRRMTYNMKKNKSIYKILSVFICTFILFLLPFGTYESSNFIIKAFDYYYVENRIESDPDPRLSNKIEENINQYSSFISEEMYIKAGAKVTLRLFSSFGEEFSVIFDGIEYHSSDGILFENINIDKTGNYSAEIFNPNKQTIRVTGSILY